MRKTFEITIARSDTRDALAHQFEEILRHARDSRIAYAIVVYGVEDRGKINDRLISLGHERISSHVGRVLLKLAMMFLGGREIAVELAPEVERQAAPTVH